MLKELTRANWLSLLGIPESRIPAVLILRGTRNLRTQYQAVLSRFDKILEIGTPNGIFEDVLIGDLGGRPVGFACVYGASMASEITHAFGVLGTRAVIQTGNCGALADDLNAGDLFLVERAFCGEGAAQYYGAKDREVSATATLLQSATLARLPEGERHIGAIYTTAALLAEGMDDLERWHHQGYAAVDMETATTYAVAEHFGMERLAILYAFDNPRRREHLLHSDAAQDARRSAANLRMKELAFELAAELGRKYEA